VVDETANRVDGHLPLLAAQLAAALSDAGCSVEAYFPHGWALEGDPQYRTLRQYRPGRLVQQIRRRLAARPRILRLVDYRIAQRRAQRTGAAVIVTSFLTEPRELLTVVTRGRWLVYQFWRDEPGRHPPQRPLQRVVGRFAAVARRVWRTHIALAVNHDAARRSWASSGLGLPVFTVDFASAPPAERTPDARTALGIAPEARVLLMFGANHRFKTPEVVWECFADDASPSTAASSPSTGDWHLLIGGAMADRYLDWCSQTGRSSQRVTARGGYATEEERRRFLSAADAIVLSFVVDSTIDSGTLADAVSFGIPIVASDRCRTGDAVSNLGLGPTFDVTSTASFAAALAGVPRTLEPAAIATARALLSPEQRVRAHLRALGLPAETRPPTNRSVS